MPKTRSVTEFPIQAESTSDNISSELTRWKTIYELACLACHGPSLVLQSSLLAEGQRSA